MSSLPVLSTAVTPSPSALLSADSRMLKVTVLDPSITSVNLGDQIIMQATRSILNRLFPDAFYVTLPTHEFFLWESYRICRDSDYVFVGGSNLLKSKMLWNNQWKISPFDWLLRRNCILLGCGWWHYQSEPDWYSRQLLQRILSHQHLHSVRDDYTRQQLQAAGMDNVRNTACITMWDLNPAHCSQIPATRAPKVMTTVTGYNANPEVDRAVISLLLKHYQEVLLWVQQPEDLPYARSLSDGRVQLIAPNLQTYTDYLQTHHVDYIGTRLHGGIRALQCGKRTLILAVDNRAVEISRDTQLPVRQRDDLAGIEQWIVSPAATHLRLPVQAIDAWQAQFLPQQHGH